MGIFSYKNAIKLYDDRGEEMDNVLELAHRFEELVALAQKTSAQPADIEKALGSLYTNDDPIYAAIDKHILEGTASFNIFLTVDANASATIKVQGKHPKRAYIENDLKALARKMSLVLQRKGVKPAGEMKVPGNQPWKVNIGYK